MIEAERRWGGPANEWAVRIYQWLFVLLGPAAVVFGLYAYPRYWSGLLIVAFGCVMTFLGYLRLWRWWKRRSV
jgi:hypothetical protein